MPDYRKMYAVLCGALDDVIDPLEQIPLACPSAAILRTALLHAEEIYLQTSQPASPLSFPSAKTEHSPETECSVL